jgi:two-component system cell cycle sensor histidine kinase/response regulator CckA
MATRASDSAAPAPRVSARYRLLAVAAVLVLANLDALVDRVLHPDIPYFDLEHVLVGGVTALVAVVLYVGLTRISRRMALARRQLRERAEEALRESEELFRRLAESMPDAVLVGQDGKNAYANAAAARLLRAGAPEELVGTDVSEVIHSAGRERAGNRMQRLMAGESVSPFEDRFVRRDGSVVPVELSVSPTAWLGRPALQVVARDITERIRAEEALELAAERTRLVLDSAGEGILGLDLQGRHTFVNSAAARMLGFGVEELLGRDSHSAWHHSRPDGSPYPEDECPVYAAYRDSKMHRTSDEAFWRKDGTSFPVEYASTPIIKDGRPTGAVVTFADITDRKRTEEALSQERSLLMALMHNVPDNIYFKDRDSRFIRISDAHARMFGLSDPAQAVGQTDFAFFTEEHARQAFEDEQAIIRSGQPLSREERETWVDRPDTWVSTTKVPLRDERGNIIGTCGISRDITALKRAETAKLEAETRSRQLEKAESLGRMAGAVAHHFNGQLQTVLLNLEMAADGLPRESNAAKNVTEAFLAAKRAAEMSMLMLTYLGQTRGARTSLDLSTACSRWLSLLEAAAPEDVVLETDLASPGPRIHANAEQMQQVVAHLVANAREAGGAGRRTVRVSVKGVTPAAVGLARRVPPDWQPLESSYACLEVADRGCGIAEADMERIFDPFYSTKFTGRGMGLAAVLGIVRAHDGVVTVESALGSGSTFRVYLPVSEGADAVPS